MRLPPKTGSQPPLAAGRLFGASIFPAGHFAVNQFSPPGVQPDA